MHLRRPEKRRVEEEPSVLDRLPVPPLRPADAVQRMVSRSVRREPDHDLRSVILRARHRPHPFAGVIQAYIHRVHVRDHHIRIFWTGHRTHVPRECHTGPMRGHHIAHEQTDRLPPPVHDHVRDRVHARHPSGFLHIETHLIIQWSVMPSALQLVIVPGRLQPGRAGQQDLRAAAPCGPSVRIDAAEPDLEVALHQEPVEIQRRAERGRAHERQVIRRIVTHHLNPAQHLLAQLPRQLRPGHLPVTSECNQDQHVLLLDPGRPEFLQNERQDAMRRSGTAQIIRKNAHTGPAPRQLAKPGRPDGRVEPASDHLVREHRTWNRPPNRHPPLRGHPERHILVPVPRTPSQRNLLHRTSSPIRA